MKFKIYWRDFSQSRLYKKEGDVVRLHWPAAMRLAIAFAFSLSATQAFVAWWLDRPFTPGSLAFPLAVGFTVFALANQASLDRVQTGEHARRWPRIGLSTALALLTVWGIAFAFMGRDYRHNQERLARQERIIEELATTAPNLRVQIVGHRNRVYLYDRGGKATDADLSTVDRILRQEFPDGPTVWLAQLQGPGVTDRALAILGEWRTLFHLSLASPNITDAGADSLIGLNNLEDLIYGGTQITEPQIDRLIEALPNLGSHRRPGAIFEPD